MTPDNRPDRPAAPATLCPTNGSAADWAIGVKTNLHGSAKAVLIHIAWSLDRGVHLSRHQIAEQAMVSTRTVTRALAELERAGLIRWHRRRRTDPVTVRDRYTLVGREYGR
jgi:DNA-binding HxlR family transcriptional regulator